MRRLQLPARKYGGGLRSLVDVAPAAFVGTLCRAAPHFANRRDDDWNEVQGFLPLLSTVLPAIRSAGDVQERPFQRLLTSGSQPGRALAAAWAGMQREVGADSQGPLQHPVEIAGHGTAKLQKALTEQRERARFLQLDVAIRRLPGEDVGRLTWLQHGVLRWHPP